MADWAMPSPTASSLPKRPVHQIPLGDPTQPTAILNPPPSTPNQGDSFPCPQTALNPAASGQDFHQLKSEVAALLQQQERRLLSLFAEHQQQMEQLLAFQYRQAMDLLTGQFQLLHHHVQAPIISTHFPSALSPPPHAPLPFAAPPPAEPPYSPPITIEFPRFAKGDPTHWIFAAERCFTYLRIPDHERLLLASIHLDNPAFTWYQCLAKGGQPPDWSSFVAAIQKRFGPSDYRDPAGQLSKLTQTTSVSAYLSSFEELSCRVRVLPPDFIRSLFISGLEPEIRDSVVVHQPATIQEAYDLARLFEARSAADGQD